MFLSILYIISITDEIMTSALSAGRRQMDKFGMIIITSVTAIGGGSGRNMLFGHFPVGWVKHLEYVVIIAIVVIIITWVGITDAPLTPPVPGVGCLSRPVHVFFHHRHASLTEYGAQ